MDKPFAITLDVGSSLANKTGRWRTERAVYVDRLPPCNHACPAGENIQRWLYEAEEGGDGYERAWRKIMEDNPFPAIMGRVCYHPCETACNRGQLDEAVGINSVERFLGDEAIKQGWRVEVTARRPGKRVLVVGAGPVGPVRRLPPHPARSRGDDPRRRPDGRRDDALRDPEVPAAPRRARRRGPADPRHGRDARAEPQGHERARGDARGRLRRGIPRGRRAHRQARLHPGRRGGAASSTPSRCCAAWRARSAAAGPARGRLRRRQHGDGRGAHRQAARRDRGDRRLPPHARPDAGPRLRGRGGRARRAC